MVQSFVPNQPCLVCVCCVSALLYHPAQTNTFFPITQSAQLCTNEGINAKADAKYIVGSKSLSLLVKMLIDGIFFPITSQPWNTTCASGRIEQKARLMKASLKEKRQQGGSLALSPAVDLYLPSLCFVQTCFRITFHSVSVSLDTLVSTSTLNE